MYPAIHAALHPDKPAVIVAGTFCTLSDRFCAVTTMSPSSTAACSIVADASCAAAGAATTASSKASAETPFKWLFVPVRMAILYSH